MRSLTHQAAIEYAARGWHVFPCVPGGKEPLTQHGHKEATRDPAQIDAWWGANPGANVAIAVAPSRLAVLDVDVGTRKDGTRKRGAESLNEILNELQPTLLAETGSGGQHIVYERPPGLEPQRVIGFRDGLDLIGDGYIIAAPSYNAQTGRYYRWTQQHVIAPLPPFLQNVTRAPRAEKVQQLGTPIVEGNRNNALFKLGCALRDTGIGEAALARALDAENKTRFNPPIEDAELGTIVASVMRRVQVTRDVAADAIVVNDMQNALGLAPKFGEEWLDQVAATPQPPVLFYGTGFPGLDKMLNGGFPTRQLVGIIGPPSTGKSALVGHWILELEKHRPVLHCSLELLKHELFVRYAAHEMRFPWVDGVRGAVDQATMAAAIKGKRIKLMGADDFDRLDPFSSLEQAVARMTAECGVAPIVVIDYIQIMARAASTEMRHKVGELTQRARQLAQRADTVVIGVFTTQRDKYAIAAVEKMRSAQDPRAYLGAAKESGDIEFDCAILMYLDVDMLHKGSPRPGQIAVSRCRYGHEGFVGLRAQLEYGHFIEDEKAVAEFASEARAEKKAADDMETACKALMETIRTMPGRPWRDLQNAASSGRGVNRTMVDKARGYLIKAGVIEELERFDEHHRKEKGKTYRIVQNTLPPTNVLPEEDGHADS